MEKNWRKIKKKSSINRQKTDKSGLLTMIMMFFVFCKIQMFFQIIVIAEWQEFIGNLHLSCGWAVGAELNDSISHHPIVYTLYC